MVTTIMMKTTTRDFTRTNIEALRVQQLFGAPLGSQQDSEDLLEVFTIVIVRNKDSEDLLEVQSFQKSQVLTELEMMYGNKVDLL